MFVTLGFSQVGVSHQQRSIPCQDCNLHRLLSDGTAIGIIADGVGASPVSQIGAQAAVEAAMNTIVSMLESGKYSTEKHVFILHQAFTASRNAVLDTASSNGTDVSMFETTLTAVIITESHIACGHCGDGGVIVLNDNGSMFPIAQQQIGQFAGQVYTLVSHSEKWTFAGADIPCSGVVLATDGMYDYFSRIEEHERGKYLLGYISACAAPNINLLAVQKSLSRHISSNDIIDLVDDDRTVLIISRTSHPLPAHVIWESESPIGESDYSAANDIIASEKNSDSNNSVKRSSKSGMIALLILAIAAVVGLILYFTGREKKVEPPVDSEIPVSSTEVSASDTASSSDMLTTSESEITGGHYE